VNQIISGSFPRHQAIHLVNAYTVYLTNSNPAYKKLILRGINFPDGKPISFIGSVKNSKVEQIRGPSLFEAVLRKSNLSGTSHFFLGGSQELLDSIVDNIRRDLDGVKIVGAFSPPFRQMNANEIQSQDDLIRKANPDIVWVGLGTPRQDFEAERITRQMGFRTIAIGAAFDFYGGTKKESPAYLSNIGLEWLFRLVSEPKRLWKRYLFGNFVFMWVVIKKWRNK
jgi:N-acetylglucosaminyldiphosphoundecaprenol N-acetyl-beta-D-mannosaminyltransferase